MFASNPSDPADAINGAITSATVVGGPAMVKRSSSLWSEVRILASACSARESKSLAIGTNAIAAEVALALGPAVKRVTPKSRSSFLIWRDNDGCPMWSSRAAAEIEPSSNTFKK